WEIHKIAKSLKYESDAVELFVHDQRNFPISTLQRFYDDSNFKEHLGFDFDNRGEIKISSNKKDFEKSFTKVVTDIVNGTVTSRTINTNEAKKEYLKNIDKPKVDKKNKIIITSKSFQPKKIQIEKRDMKLVPDYMTCTSTSAGVLRMYDELKTINYRKFPNATLDLIRSFLECALKSYFQINNIDIRPKRHGGYVYLSDVLEAYSDDKTKPKGLDQIVRMIRDNNGYYPESKNFLDGINHNHDLFAVDKDVKTAWDKMESIFKHILN
ncbi:MAG: hypothetical protein PHD33_05520, partial [Atribacterota bacterium]|nr:hypothetical protein [Atribacterota bacterium]